MSLSGAAEQEDTMARSNGVHLRDTKAAIVTLLEKRLDKVERRAEEIANDPEAPEDDELCDELETCRTTTQKIRALLSQMG